MVLNFNYVKLEDGQVRLQSRLEQEEEAKAALLGRIQRLTKLILVSTKASPSTRFPNRPGPRRRHSFGEEEVFFFLLSIFFFSNIKKFKFLFYILMSQDDNTLLNSFLVYAFF